MTLLATTSIAAVSLYAMLSTVYKSAQVFHARRTTISTTPAKDIETTPVPSVDVIVPCFNEDPIILSECLASLAEQDYAGKLRFYVVDDGSKNRDALSTLPMQTMKGSTS
jgi:N-acetylglucosaminyltransferase